MLINRKVEHLGAVGIRVPSNVWTETIRFYADILGLQIEDKSESCILMRAKRDRKAYTLALYRSDRPGLQFGLWKVPEAADLEEIARVAGEHSLSVKAVSRDTLPGITNAIEVIDQGGHRMVYTDRLPMSAPRPEPYRGISVHAIDHLNINYKDTLEQARSYYMDGLGFQLSDRADIGGTPLAYWTRVSDKHHDLAIMAGGNFFHHVAFRVVGPDDLRRALDQFADLNYPVEVGPGAHSPSGMYFIYVKDPAGNRVELYLDEGRSWEHWEPRFFSDLDKEKYPLKTLLARWGEVPPPPFYETGT
ncbi:MAG: VOC family protein [Rhizobiaceae bacterium]|nr:VOC family protein [Rhizobiaceae bacterium]